MTPPFMLPAGASHWAVVAVQSDLATQLRCSAYHQQVVSQGLRLGCASATTDDPDTPDAPSPVAALASGAPTSSLFKNMNVHRAPHVIVRCETFTQTPSTTANPIAVPRPTSSHVVRHMTLNPADPRIMQLGLKFEHLAAEKSG